MPKQLNIITHPNSALRKQSTPLSPEEINQKEFQEFLGDLEETMLKKDGAGLAAPQVGRTVRVVVIHNEGQNLFLINPQITRRSWAREIEEEGCLSVLDEKGEILYGPVERYKKISCVYLDRKGEKKKISGEKMMARVIQHEIDHLDGVLFIDKLVPGGKLTVK